MNQEVERVCKKYGFTLYKYANNFNHLHILIRITHRYRWAAFIRELTGRIAQIVKRLLKQDVKFWLGRPFTRILKGWGRNFKRAKEYVELNIIEATRNFTREEAKAHQSLQQEFG